MHVRALQKLGCCVVIRRCHNAVKCKGSACESRVVVASSQRERVGAERDCSRKGVGTLIRSTPMFFILQTTVDSLATAIITYRNEDRLTQKDQRLNKEHSTSLKWRSNSNDPFIYP